MKGLRRRWLWLLLPTLLIMALLAAGPQDDFAEYARRGKPFDPQAVSSLLQGPQTGIGDRIVLSMDKRARAWALLNPYRVVCQQLEDRGFASSRNESISGSFDDGSTFEYSFEEFGLNEGDTQIVVVGGTKVPKGYGCVILVQEPTGLRAAWRRFVARLHGFPKP